MLLAPGVLKWKFFAASSGPGGQHVNKVATAVELRCKVVELGLPEFITERLVKLAGRRMTGAGELVLVAKDHRSQERNKAEAYARLVELVLEAQKVPKKRRATKPSKSSKVKRVEGKTRRAKIKKNRGRVRGDD